MVKFIVNIPYPLSYKGRGIREGEKRNSLPPSP
jgi:hypothetical protein